MLELLGAYMLEASYAGLRGSPFELTLSNIEASAKVPLAEIEHHGYMGPLALREDVLNEEGVIHELWQSNDHPAAGWAAGGM